MATEYRLIPGFGEAYRVGDDGSVWSRKIAGRGVSLGQWHRMNCEKDRDGYLQIALYGGAKRYYKVHRLVLECFVGPCPDGMQTRHLNGNPADNRRGNLKWDTPTNNVRDRVKHGTHFTPWKGELNHKGKLTEQKVREIRNKHADGQSQYSLARDYAVNSSTIHGIIHRKYWKHVT